MTRQYITLPLPASTLKLAPDLALVMALEETRSLLKTAEMLLSRELRVSEVLLLLRICYRAAGCRMDDAALDAWLLGRSPASLLADILSGILTPLAALGVVAGVAPPGERLASAFVT